MNGIDLKGDVRIEVKYTIKKVKSESIDLSGRIEFKQDPSGYELKVPIDSFKSSDKDFDAHLQQTCESNLYPSAFGRGSFEKRILKQEKFSLPVKIEFHGVEKEYMINFFDQGRKATFRLNLDFHGIKRPSLLGIKINNEVMIEFNLKWP